MNNCQYGFTPQRSTIDVAMKAKDFVRNGLGAEVIVFVSLDVEGSFHAAWWPSVLNGLRECDCPRNLYDLTRSYLSQRTATLSTKNVRMVTEVSRGCRKDLGPPGIVEYRAKVSAEPPIREAKKRCGLCR
jgi:methionyl-tRNA synthetase